LSWGTLLLGLALVAACGSTPVAEGPPTPLPPQPPCRTAANREPLCIVVLGDSIASGVPLEGDDRWWVRLGSMLRATFPGRSVVVDSWAVPGSQVDVLESAAGDQPALGSYDVAIVIEGVNDQASLPMDAWRDRYKAAISAIESRGLVVIVATPPPSFEDGSFATRYDATAAAIRDVAAGGRPLLDIAARWHADGASVAATYYSDLVHQGVVGQRLMADMARDTVVDAVNNR
jgi:lysophospholipase L1-like esterase